MSATPSRIDLPARHRGRTARSKHTALAGIAAIWLGAVLGMVLVALDWRPAALIVLVGLLLLGGAAVHTVARIRLAGQIIDDAVTRILRR